MFQTETEVSASITDTFYTFPAQPNGEYWYRVAATDAEGQEGRLSQISYTNVATYYCCEVIGDVDGSGQLDILDANYYINWLWLDGPEPGCLEEADTDGDLITSALDIDRIIGYLFRDEAAPVECHALE